MYTMYTMRLPTYAEGENFTMMLIEGALFGQVLVYDCRHMLGATYDELNTRQSGDDVSDIERWLFRVERSHVNPALPVVSGAQS